MEKCPKCGSDLIGTRPDFCSQCGWDVTRPVSEKALPPSNKKILRSDVLDSIALYINTNQFYMEGFGGVLHLKLENHTDDKFDSVEIELSSKLFGSKTDFWRCRLDPHTEVEKKFQIRPTNAGHQLIYFKINAKKDRKVNCYWTEVDLPIFEKAEKLGDVSIQADKLIDVGSVANGKSMGNVIKVQIDSLIKQGNVKNSNDLMTEYGKLPSNFVNLNLKLDKISDVPTPRCWWPWVLATALIVIVCITAVKMHQYKIKQEGIASVQSAKKEYETVLTNYNLEILKKHGGKAWADVGEAITFARSSGQNFDMATQWYQRAVELLPAAWEKAKETQEKLRKETDVLETAEKKNNAETADISDVVIYDFDKGLHRLIQELKDRIDAKHEIAFLNRITGTDNIRTEFDVVLENKMLIELQADEKLCLIGSTTALNDSTPIKVTINRYIEDSTLILSGLITDSGVHRRLNKVQIELNDYLQTLLSRTAATQEEIKKNPQLKPNVIELPPLELRYSITGMHNSDGVWAAVPVNTGRALNSGDCFKINFETNEDCFVYVFLYGSAGIAQCLFPHEKIALENHIKGGKLCSLPDGENWYYLDDVPGTEIIYIVACYEPMKDIASLLTQMEQTGSSKQRGLSENIQREISNIRTRGLESDKYVISQFRGVSHLAPEPKWNLWHNGKIVPAVTKLISGKSSAVKVISFEHR